MHFAERDIDRFVFAQHLHVFADRHFGRALDDDPVLGAVVMLLQRQLLARQHEDALDLETLAVQHRGIAAPGAVRGGVRLGELGRLLLACEHLDELADFLAILEMADIDGVLAGDDGDILKALHGDVEAVRHDERILGVDQRRGTRRHVAAFVTAADFPDRIPAAEIGPVKGEGTTAALAVFSISA